LAAEVHSIYSGVSNVVTRIEEGLRPLIVEHDRENWNAIALGNSVDITVILKERFHLQHFLGRICLTVNNGMIVATPG
jgi:hypothetical protein